MHLFVSGAFLSAGLVFSALAFALTVGLMFVPEPAQGRWRSAFLRTGGVAAGALAGTWPITQNAPATLLACAMAIALAMISAVGLRRFSVTGRLLLIGYAQLTAWGSAWGLWFLTSIHVSDTTRVLLFGGAPLLALTLPSALVTTFESWEVLCRKRWQRPRTRCVPQRHSRHPKVSIHVPASSEPAEVVVSTLDALSRLEYPNFEVLVIDNNTADERLWRPVAEHCRRLGARFRFFHLPHCAGAKAGALNFALTMTAPDAELISVIDADYHAEPDFLRAVVGYFEDAKVGFVQTPHDYREWAENRYLRWCRWEYRYFFDTTMVSLNERDAALIVGTMCVIRRRALEDAGRWSQTCLTEDSELAIRIHALGYSSVYLQETFGRGLIPETFEGYKKQRFRWTYGPVQELKKHLPLFLPSPVGTRSRLTIPQRIHHMNHGLDRLNIGLGLLLMPLGLAVLASMAVHREVIAIPPALWVAATVVLASGIALKWAIYRMIGCPLPDAIGASIASRALHHTISVASAAAALSVPAHWRRTNKFRTRQTWLNALRGVRIELALGMFGLGSAGAVLLLLPHSGLATMLVIGASMQSAGYLAAVAMTVVAYASLRPTRAPDAERVAAEAAWEGSAAGGQ